MSDPDVSDKITKTEVILEKTLKGTGFSFHRALAFPSPWSESDGWIIHPKDKPWEITASLKKFTKFKVRNIHDIPEVVKLIGKALKESFPPDSVSVNGENL